MGRIKSGHAVQMARAARDRLPAAIRRRVEGGRHPPGAGTRTDGPYIRKKEEAHSSRRGPPLARESAPLWPAASCSPTDCTAVPSALGGLASGFGMGPGVTPPPWPPATKGRYSLGGGPLGRALRAAQRDRVRGLPHRRSHEGRARPISTARLHPSRGFHLRPINLVVYEGPYRRENSSLDRLPA